MDRKVVDKQRRRTCFNLPLPLNLQRTNPNLEDTLSVKTVLKDLELLDYEPIFCKEEVTDVLP